MPPKLISTTKQIKEAGAFVHACAHLILGDRTAKRYFGNRNFNGIKLQDVVKSSTNGKTKPNDQAQWTLNVDFTLPDTGGASHEVINRDILARNCTPGELPAGSNKKNGVIITGVISAAAAAATATAAATTAATTTAATATTSQADKLQMIGAKGSTWRSSV